MTKTDIAIYRGLKEKFDPGVHVGFFITSDTGELLLGDQSLGQTISGWEINDGVLKLKLNTGRDILVTFPEATETVKGLLSAADKAQLNALQENLDSKVDKVTGKSLLADSEIEKLAGLPNSTELTNSIATAKAAGDNAQSDLNAHKQNKSNPHEVTKDQVGLGNVTNDAQVKRSEMGVANGVATLDADGKVPASQLPSYVDDIIDVYATYSKSDTGVLSNVTLYLDAAHTQLVTGEAGKIYQNIADGEPQYQFRWTGTIFSQTGASSLILGEVTGTAYDGAKGKANADNIAKIKGTSLSHIKDAAPITTAADKVSLNYECFEGDQYGAAGTDHTADIPAATTAKAGVMSAADKTKLENLNSKLVVADEEDVTAVDGKIKFKDRDTTNGMGYKILRLPENGILTQDMINQANTIYEIRYNFDLNGTTITIPENCTLKFEGGSITNGTINTSDLKIAGTSSDGILYGVTFTGDILNTLFFNVDWFIKEFVDRIYLNSNPSIDNSVEINMLIASGAQNIVFSSDKYYYIKNSIKINGGTVNIHSSSPSGKFDISSRVSTLRKCCIYSNEIVTLIDYTYLSGSSNKKNSLYVGDIKLFCNKSYTDLSDKDVPIFKLVTGNSGIALWGVELNCSIAGIDRVVNLGSGEKHIPNYTGISIEARESAITYVKVGGYIQTTYYGVVLKKVSPQWFTDFTLNGDTWCVKGGIFDDCGSPVRIFGSHQPIAALSPDNNEGYFRGYWINNYGYVWDTGNVQDNYSTVKSSIEYSKIAIRTGNLGSVTYKNNSYERYDAHSETSRNMSQVNNGYSLTNLLHELISVKSDHDVIGDFNVTVNDSEIVPSASYSLYNSHNLFNDLSGVVGIDYQYLDVIKDASFVTGSNISKLTVQFSINCSNLSYTSNKALDIVLNARGTTVELTVTYQDGNSDVITSSREALYYKYNFLKYKIREQSEGKINVRIDLSFDTPQTHVVMPSLAVLAPLNRKFIYGGPTNKRPVFFIPSNHKGHVYYDSDLNKELYWDGTKWVDPAEDSIKWRTIE